MNKNEEKTIVCRCSDVTLGDVRRMIARGYTTFDELKRQLRVGMGACQGKTCGLLIQRELAAASHCSIAALPNQTSRPLTVSVPLNSLAEGEDNHE